MQTPRISCQPLLTEHLLCEGLFQSEPLCLVDVGASGGIDQYWNVFGTQLRAFGFDPLLKEVERLNSIRHAGDQKFFAYLVGYRRYDELFPPQIRNDRQMVPDTQPFPRTSAVRATTASQCDYVRTYYDQTGAGLYATETIELDEFFLETHPSDVDFIKIDTDGSDYQALLGAQQLIQSKPVLGVAIECQFHGLVHDDANTFSNIDRLLRRLGFSLFDLEVYRYSRAVLPRPFVYRIPAQTVAGQVLWADALYLRDAGQPDYEATWKTPLTERKILKLVALSEIFGVEDCAAELMMKYRDRLTPLIDVGRCLDLITPRLRGEKLSYQRYNEMFDKHPERFFPPS
jgi:FkbM family methyltransferase